MVQSQIRPMGAVRTMHTQLLFAVRLETDLPAILALKNNIDTEEKMEITTYVLKGTARYAGLFSSHCKRLRLLAKGVFAILAKNIFLLFLMI